MIGSRTFLAAALISTISATSALAQAALSEPAAFEAAHPDRDVLNGGALTPAGRLGLQQSYAPSTANSAYAEIGGAGRALRVRRHHSTR